MDLSGSSKAFLLVLLVAALVLGGGVIALGAANRGSSDEGKPVTVEVPEGAGASHVGDLLAEKDVVRSAFAFKIAARFDERAERIGAGTYDLRTGMGTSAALDRLTGSPDDADRNTFRVTIPEGRTAEQTLEHLADAEGSPFTVEELEEALAGVALPDWVPSDVPDVPRPHAAYEGLLFPDSYEFAKDADPQKVLDRLMGRTEEVMEDISPPAGVDRYEVLTMASLVEREARVPEEQERIAAVMHNRLDKPMRLQVDATVIYAHGEHLDRVLNSHLEIDSPWNTYRNDGLPPTPISGAGESAIRAAANPADEDALYYVVIDPETGEHAFADTLEEHNRNKAEAKKRREALEDEEA